MSPEVVTLNLGNNLFSAGSDIHICGRTPGKKTGRGFLPNAPHSPFILKTTLLPRQNLHAIRTILFLTFLIRFVNFIDVVDNRRGIIVALAGSAVLEQFIQK